MNELNHAYAAGVACAVMEKTAGPKTELLRKLLPGAGLGAASGAGIGALTGEDTLQSALLGAGLGAGAGTLGAHLFRKSRDVQAAKRALEFGRDALRRIEAAGGPGALNMHRSTYFSGPRRIMDIARKGL